MLDRLVEGKWLRANGVFGLFPANQVEGDDIEVYTDESRRPSSPRCTSCVSRRKAAMGPPASRWPTSWRPRATGLRDYVGRLRRHRGTGCDEQDHGVQGRIDDYSAILLESLADRLAEAFAERLHERVRKEFWAYAPDEHWTTTR